MSKVQDARVLRKRWQSLIVANDNTTIINAEDLCDEWVPGTADKPKEYVINMSYRRLGQVYKCCQTHVNHGESGWEPENSSALFVIAHTKDTANPKPFVHPTGAHDVYMKDECMLYTDGLIYVSLIDNNSYSPEEYAQGWNLAE